MDDEDGRLIALARAGRRFAECVTLEELLPLAAELARETLQASSASVARLEHDRGLLRVLHNAGELAAWEESDPCDETYALAGFPLLAATVESAAPWFGDLGDPQTGESHHELLRAMGMQSSISLPVIIGSTVWGEVGAARSEQRPSFSPGDMAAGEAYCGLLAAAITRIVERDTLHALAFNDALTGLGNRRAIDERLEGLFAPETLARSIAVILCDVDGLKRINDLHGHDAGDRVLREVATLLSRAASSHPDSLAVRLGGDEFCLLLEGVPEEVVREISDGLIASSRELPLGAGLSAGWTHTEDRPGQAPSASMAARAVLRLADAAQYRTKRAGKAMEPAARRERETQDATAVRQRVLEAALGELDRADADTACRLQAVAVGFARVINACTWSVSRSVGEQPVEVVAQGDAKRNGGRGAYRVEPGISFALSDYPARAAAMRGAGFHATIDAGDDAERGYLAAHGYDEAIAAGTPEDARTAWLVELLGDALSPSFSHALPLLRSLVELAVTGREPRGPTTGYDGSSG